MNIRFDNALETQIVAIVPPTCVFVLVVGVLANAPSAFNKAAAVCWLGSLVLVLIKTGRDMRKGKTP